METRGKLEPVDAAYIAGFIDGEGCIGLYKKAKQKESWTDMGYQVYLGISQNSTEVLEWIQQRIGGIVSKKKRYQQQHKVGYSLQLRGLTKVEAALKEIQPYLKVKHEQAELVLKFAEDVNKVTASVRVRYRGPNIPIEEQEKRKFYFEEIKRLNQRGSSIAATTNRENTVIGEVIV